MTPSIRRATPLDKKQLLHIEDSCFTYDKITPSQMHYLLTKAKATTFVFTQETIPIGYAMMFTPKHPKPARLYSLAVLPNHQGKNIGSQLIGNHRSQQLVTLCIITVRSSCIEYRINLII